PQGGRESHPSSDNPSSKVEGSIDPDAAAIARLDRGVDEAHAARAVFDGGHEERKRIRLALLDLGPDLFGQVAIEVGEALEIAFGMAGWHSRGAPGGGAEVAGPAAQSLGRLAQRREAELVGMLLAPVEPALLAIDPEPQAVLVAWRHLACPDQAAHAL